MKCLPQIRHSDLVTVIPEKGNLFLWQHSEFSKQCLFRFATREAIDKRGLGLGHEIYGNPSKMGTWIYIYNFVIINEGHH